MMVRCGQAMCQAIDTTLQPCLRPGPPSPDSQDRGPRMRACKHMCTQAAPQTPVIQLEETTGQQQRGTLFCSACDVTKQACLGRLNSCPKKLSNLMYTPPPPILSSCPSSHPRPGSCRHITASDDLLCTFNCRGVPPLHKIA